MKQYQRCKVNIIVLNEQDVVKTSVQATEVTLDRFNDTWWTEIGGAE